jgi:MtrB/PioB family decaheme-associated outer membrane protein
MRRFAITTIALLGLAAPGAVLAQGAAQPPAPSSTQPPAKPAAPAAPAAPDAADASDASRSLFEPTAREFLIGGRVTSVDGDPARYQRYQDQRDGVLFSNFRYSFAEPDGTWDFHARAENVGYRDQEFMGTYDRIGQLSLSGSWQQIPQFYSVDTMTPYTGTGATLVLDDAAQRAIQNGDPAKLNLYVPLAPAFELRERRDIGRVDLVATPKQNLDVTASFTTQKHSGELPWGASFGFSNDVEVALPYDSRANDLTLGTEWTNTRSMLRVAYSGSWFDNIAPTLVWDSPLRLDDDFDLGPGRGRMSLWPSNSAQTISVAGYTKLAHKTQVTGSFSYGLWSNDEPLQPFTINATLPQLALPRTTTEGKAHVFSTNLSLTSRPVTDWRFSARVRNYTYNNLMPVTSITDMISYDDARSTTPTGGPDLYAHSRTTFDGDATWTKLMPFAVTVGYSHNGNGYDARIVESSGENVFRVSADAVGTSWLTFRTQYEVGDRTGSGLDESQLTAIGEHPEMRHYDLADRTRNRFTAQADIVPSDAWTFSVATGILKDDFNNSFYGLQDSTGRTFSLAADFHRPNGMGVGGSYNFERYAGLQRSHEGDDSTAQFNDPLRDWTADSTETVNYFSIYANPPRIGRGTEIRVAYDFSYVEGNYLYTIPAGSPIPTPNQLPNVFNKLQQLHLDVRHRLSGRLSASFSYLYEPLSLYDFAFDPSVVNGIVQPSSLVLGYVYRPYTAHSAVFGLRYFW